MAGKNVDLAQPGRRMENARRARRQKKNGKGKIGALRPPRARLALSLGNVELKEEGNKAWQV